VILAVRLGLRLALGSGRDQRLRAVSVLVAVCVGAVVLLATAAIARSQQLQQPGVFQNPDNQRLLAAAVASILFPVLVLAATVGRLSAGLRDRRMANLRLLGMGRLPVRMVAAVETGVAAFAGALLGILGFLAARQQLSHVRVAGHGWPSYTLWPPAWTYFAVVLLLPAVVMAVGAVPQRLRMADALARARRADARRPGWWRVVPLALGALGCLYVIQADVTKGVGASVVVALFTGISLLGIGLILLVPVFVRLLADLTLRTTRRPTLTVAARRLQAQPAGVSRAISGLLIGLFLVVGARAVVVAFESTPQYQQAAAQLTERTLATFQSSPREATRTMGELESVPGVHQVIDFPRLATRCGARASVCLSAVVASCRQLERVVRDLQGCRDDVPTTTTSYVRIGHGRSAPLLFPMSGIGDVRKHFDGQPVRLTDAEGPLHSGLEERWDGGALGPLYADVVVPPDTPGVAALVNQTQHVVLVAGDPGRALANRLLQLPLNLESVPDSRDYDFVAQLRALVWSIVAVMLSVGLLAFAVSAVDRAVNRRSEVTALQLVGVPRSVLRRTQWIEAAAPLALGCCLAIGFGLLAGETYLSLDSGHRSGPWMQSLVLGGLAALGSVLVGALTVIASSPRISPDLIRQE
jgi:hypothetical protein